MSYLRLRLCVVIGALIALVGSANAFAAGDLVVSQVYGGGGNAGASYTHDFIEIFNRGSVAQPLNGMSVQYASATGTGNFGASTTQITELPNVSLQPGQYLLIQEFSQAAVGAPPPTPDVVDATPINMSGTAGKVALVSDATSLGCNGSAGQPCSPAALARIVDLIGYGNANFFEGAGAAPTLTSTSSAARNALGCTDTDNNNADVSALTPPGPRNTSSPFATCGGPPAPTNPSATGAANPSSVPPGAQTTLTVTVTPGANPTSTGISASGDLTSIGGSATTSFADNGIDPDVTAGDNVFTHRATVATGTTPGSKSIPVTATDAQARSGTASISLLVEAPPAPLVAIREIQGAAHISPLVNQIVATRGVVTSKFGSSFYIQDPAPDADPATSEGIQVFGLAVANTVSIGELLTVQGRVTEFRASGAAPNPNLTITELTSPQLLARTTTSDTIVPSLIGIGGRVPPDRIFSNDASSGNVETSGAFDPAEDGLDFWESFEGMLVQMNSLLATSFTFTNFGEVWVLGDNGANASVLSPAGSVVISEGDLNPERIVIDDEWFKAGGPAAMPAVNVGGTFPGAHVGILDWAFGEYRIQLRDRPTVGSTGISVRESTVAAGADEVSVATFNVENLSGGEGDAKYNALAAMIVNNLASPDILGLEEIQDNNGAVGGTGSPVVDADVTLNRLIAAIQAAGGPTYTYRQINPVAHQDGGEPGGNIRVGFLYRTDRGVAFVDRPGGDSTTAVSVVSTPDGPELSVSPGRIAPTDGAWATSRKPLVGEFTYSGHTLFVIVNHFNSKGGDQLLFGPWQPPTFTSEVQRNKQATLVADFVGDLLAADPQANVAVVGDINDFQFSNPMNILKGAGLHALIETLPLNERYSYNFDGNAQALDHILVSGALFDHAAAAAGYDIVHVNAGFSDQISDHDPQLVRLTLRPSYAYVCELAREYSSEKKVAQRLCDKLRQAEHEEQKGKINKRNDLLDGFIEIVEEHRGRSFTADEATTLIALAQALKQS